MDRKIVALTCAACISPFALFMELGGELGIRELERGICGGIIGGRDGCFLLAQAIRVLGLLGALDPYKHKVNIGMIDQSRDASAVSLSESKSSQDSCELWELGEICQVPAAVSPCQSV